MKDLRLYTVTSVEDATVCNDEKLESGSTAAYITSARLFFQETIFREGQPWPDVIWAPSNMVDLDEAPNVQINVSRNNTVDPMLLSLEKPMNPIKIICPHSLCSHVPMFPCSHETF